jgi:hypothetical protein
VLQRVGLAAGVLAAGMISANAIAAHDTPRALARGVLRLLIL